MPIAMALLFLDSYFVLCGVIQPDGAHELAGLVGCGQFWLCLLPFVLLAGLAIFPL